MNTIREKCYAKVNLFLDVLQKEQEYHNIDTVVATINLYDSVTVTKRKDKKIVLRTGGGLYKLPCQDNRNNAYKAAELFQSFYNTSGVDITVTKKIPIGSGLGGSSADIAGTLNAMKKLFAIDDDVKPLADRLGSDAGFMVTGGFARLKGRGTEIEFLDDINTKLYFVILTPKCGTQSGECYLEYDKNPVVPKCNGGDKIVNNLKNGMVVKEDFYNALYSPASRLTPQINVAYGLIDRLSPLAVNMSGSGSSVYGVFQTKELCLWAEEKLKHSGFTVTVCETLNKKELYQNLFKNPFSLN